jgi:probable F420-dependent oxidoreductase
MPVLSTPDRIRIGLTIGGGEPPAVLDFARRAERAGLDSLWTGDHISFHVPMLESLSLLSFVAGATSRVQLGTAVYLLALRHPTVAAKISSTVDRLSGGRLVFGVGVGGEFPPEWDAVGVPVAERGSRTDEGIEVVRRLWREDRVAHEGKHFRFGPITLAPKPLQPGGPPIWIGGRRGPAFRRAGRMGDGYLSHMCSPERYATNLAEIEQHARAAGREGARFEPAAFLFTILDERYEAAVERAVAMLERIYRVPFREAAPKYTLLGRPADCLDQLRRFAKAGCRHFVLAPLSPHDEALEQLSRGVLPELPSLLR